ncbi:MAG: hypothetical protein CEO22_267 [Candidatus Berkelbacteria bacterium Gr01-1014_85]|uniref:Uncharacterized protein n=1 Tax=Candidatus Berkelbacteria bacterium Gr01-1014_85 TaxID=2017150 RepID=A0A554JC86_9BACT|nr:MAG: hypothetical protein CEO22_267 [Candidatus Berkelbacteria bacterium Gr01-1014_85]
MQSPARFVLSLSVLLVVLAAIVWFLTDKGVLPKFGGSGKADGQAASAYRAVFLTGNIVYFGQLESETSDKIVLKDIYYLQFAQSPQGSAETAANQEQQSSLVKLGSELHGPTDQMDINKDHVLFTETLKEDSKVIEAIKRYQKNGPDTATAGAQSSATPTASATPKK